jgi:hypothetical protein
MAAARDGAKVWACAESFRSPPRRSHLPHLVAANGGACPLGPLQERLGDPVPLCALVLSPRAAKRAVPAFGILAAVGIALLAVGRPSTRDPSRTRCMARPSGGVELLRLDPIASWRIPQGDQYAISVTRIRPLPSS